MEPRFPFGGVRGKTLGIDLWKKRPLSSSESYGSHGLQKDSEEGTPAMCIHHQAMMISILSFAEVDANPTTQLVCVHLCMVAMLKIIASKVAHYMASLAGRTVYSAV